MDCLGDEDGNNAGGKPPSPFPRLTSEQCKARWDSDMKRMFCGFCFLLLPGYLSSSDEESDTEDEGEVWDDEWDSGEETERE